VSAAWEQDVEWGTFVWLTFITGGRRGELLGLAWEHLDLAAALLTIRRNLVRQNGKITIKETKTHQMRIVSLDPATIAILTSHKQRAQRRCTELGTTLDDDLRVLLRTRPPSALRSRRHHSPVHEDGRHRHAFTRHVSRLAADRRLPQLVTRWRSERSGIWAHEGR
jgi:integrase